MDLYVCSTLRHFMFALLKAGKNTNQNSLIIMILDQQGLNEQQFNLSVLPDHVSVRLVTRKSLLNKIYRGPIGFIHKLYATTFIPSKIFERRTRELVLNKELGVDSNTKIRLFLFNDRNRLARLLRLIVGEYQVIEDGLSNYSGSPLNTVERLISRSREYRYIGDDGRCSQIWLLNKSAAPEAIKDKVQAIDFVDTDVANELLLPIFKVERSLLDGFQGVLIATQPISMAGVSSTGLDLLVYQEVVRTLEEKGIHYQFKVHPRESEEKYTSTFPNASFIDSKIPLELLLFSQSKKVNILSIYSSAGMGFERFCNRLTLVKDSESEKQQKIYSSWANGLDDVKQRLKGLRFD